MSINYKSNLFLNIFYCCISFSFCFIPNSILLTSTKLSDGNFLIMTDKGILIYDETLTTLINKTDITFNSNIYENFIYQLNKENEDFIILTAKQTIFILDSKGHLIYRINSVINNPLRSYHLIIPYSYSNNKFIFYYIYNKYQSIYFEKHTYYNAINSIYQKASLKNFTYSNLCSSTGHNNLVSCHLIIYQQKEAFICFIASHYSDQYINFIIFNIQNNLSPIVSKLLFATGYEINSAKNDLKNEQKVLMISRSLNWVGIDILDNSYLIKNGTISLVNGCNIISYINITYFKETEEFIASFISQCNGINKNYIYIFLYSFNKNFNCTFLGAIRPFTLGDSKYCCDYNNGFDYQITYSIHFSDITQKYAIIGNLLDRNNISMFILNKDIKVINGQKGVDLSSRFICENYSNINKTNCSSALLNEINSFSNIFIEKCAYDFDIINSTCPIKFNKIPIIDSTQIINTKEEQKQVFYNTIVDSDFNDEKLKDIYNMFEDGSLDSALDNILYGDKEDIVITDNNNNIIQISSSENLKDKTKKTNTMDLGECEEILKTHYNIDKDLPLLILTIDKNPGEDNSLISQLEYEVFHPVNKTPLNLSLCKDTKISVFYNLHEGFDKDNYYKYNQNSDYYNDICFTNNSNDGVDMSVNDRRNEFVDNNMNLCENDCNFIDFDFQNNKSECECNVKSEISIMNIEIDTQQLVNNFQVKISSNIGIIKCYYLIFKKENIIKNIGNYILLVIILIYIILTIIFIIKGYKLLKKQIKYLINYLKIKNFGKKYKNSNINIITTSVKKKRKNKDKKNHKR